MALYKTMFAFETPFANTSHTSKCAMEHHKHYTIIIT